MQNNYYELSVCVNGRPIREYGHKGLTYVEGRHGQHYSIKFRNNTAARVLAVISVDCVDVVDGKPATQDSRGYVVPGYQSVEIHGWRTSKKKVNDFVFDTKPRAYSTQSQKSDINCGIVGVKVFSELIEFDFNELLVPKKTWAEHHHHHYYPPPPPPPISPYTIICSTAASAGHTTPTYGCSLNSGGVIQSANNSSFTLSNSGNGVAAGQLQNSPAHSTLNAQVTAAPAPAPVQETPSFNLGTGWGKERVDEIEEVKFKRGSELSSLEIYYTDAAGLKAAGIEIGKKPAVSKPTMPKAFHGFCTPPVVTSS